MIDVRDMELRQGDRNLVSGFCLNVDAGEVVGLVGRSGSGKSTFLRSLLGLSSDYSGSVSVGGIDLPSASEGVKQIIRRERVSWVPQELALVDDWTVLRNLELAFVGSVLSRSERRVRMLEALAEFGLQSALEARAGQLSGGEKQRVAIVRGMLRDAPLVLADEPSAWLDDSNTASFMAWVVRKSRAGASVLLVSHDARVLGDCDRLVHFGGPESAER